MGIFKQQRNKFKNRKDTQRSADVVHREYNCLHGDINMKKIPFEYATEIIKDYVGEWIYIKYIDRVNDINDKSYDAAIYTKFKVRAVNIDEFSDSVRIYGVSDKDRLILSKEAVIQTETTYMHDAIRIVFMWDKVMVDVYISKYSPVGLSRLDDIRAANKHLIVTEGKTDWKHLKHALNKFNNDGKYTDLEVNFFEFEDDIAMGNVTLKKICEYQSLFRNEKLKIFIYDSDDTKINKDHEGKKYIYHGNNVYSFILPVPEHRKDTPLISIENYYLNKEIQLYDSNHRRLFLAEEFDKNTGKHIEEQNIYTCISNNTEPNHILDDKVFKIEEEISVKDDIFKCKNKTNIALSKSNFANNILNDVPPFDGISYANFSLVFDVIEDIFKDYRTREENEANKDTTKICDGVSLIDNAYGFKTLIIAMEVSDDTFIQIRSAKYYTSRLTVSDDSSEVEFIYYYEENSLRLPIKITPELVEFLQMKIFNVQNKIEFHLINGKYGVVSEVLSGEISLSQIIPVYETICTIL